MATWSRRIRALLRTPLPHGVVSWRYLWPGADERVRLHRRLWWEARPHWPRAVWLAVELWLWLRWVGFSGWRAVWRVWRARSGETEARGGLSRARQLARLVALSLGHGIPPGEVYRYRLLLDPARAWDYVFVPEVAAYHRWRNRGLGGGREAVALLADKPRLDEVLAALGVPTVPTLACVPRGGDAAFSSWLAKGGRLFCKTRSGNRGIGAFTVWRQGEELRGRGFDGQPLSDPAAVELAWRALRGQDDALVQPCLENHPALAPLAVGGDAITLRYISHRLGERVKCLCATLELPAGWDPRRGRPRYLILPVAPDGGGILPLPGGFPLDRAGEERYTAVMEQLAPETPVPHWPELVEACHRAHGRFPQLWAIAWDWVVTPQGPRLLEGNSGWEVATPQMLRGGFLHAEADPHAQPDSGFPSPSR
ncbi:sugar-transfer associated ATP-grasp domain-containing protein [Endothiovibrio diazotrophicus]